MASAAAPALAARPRWCRSTVAVALPIGQDAGDTLDAAAELTLLGGAPSGLDLPPLSFALLTSSEAAKIAAYTGAKRYVVVHGAAWYMTPSTTASWDWGNGKQLTGRYEYRSSTGGRGSFVCTGSGE